MVKFIRNNFRKFIIYIVLVAFLFKIKIFLYFKLISFILI